MMKGWEIGRLADHGQIVVVGAREHNLCSVNVDLPRDQLIVVTGVSGSGKSSLAFDTIYAEGQRRYVESLSAGARQHLGQLRRPDVDRIDGLSPAIAIGQKAGDNNPRSTVATVTEIYDYLRVLYARLGGIVCCGQPVGRQTTTDMAERLQALPLRSRIQLLAPVARARRGQFQELFDDARRAGFVRVRVDGAVLDLSDDIRLDGSRRHDVELVVDRLVLRADVGVRLLDSLELALRHGEGTVIVNVLPPDENDPQAAEDLFFSRDYACPRCGTNYHEPSPQLFSFNSPQGMCDDCQGLGQTAVLDEALVVPDESLSINAGAIAPWGVPSTLNLKHKLTGISQHFGFSLDTPWAELPADIREVILHGSSDNIRFVYRSGRGRRTPYEGTWDGVAATLGNQERVYDPDDDGVHGAARWMTTIPCAGCAGQRLSAAARQVQFEGLGLGELCQLTVEAAAEFFDSIGLRGQRELIGADLLREIRGRLNFLLNVGLHYLTLERSAPSLSGGEAQRIRLASQIGAGLVGVTYVLDEPSIGLHHRDNRHLLSTLGHLRDLGNTVIVVEHDEETMLAADYLVDVGPGPGRLGGKIVAAGPPETVLASPDSLTADYLSGRRAIETPTQRRPVDPERLLTVRGAAQNNLRQIDVSFPLGTLIAVTGVSGSGKSSLVNDILHDVLAAELNRARRRGGRVEAVEGIEHLDKVIAIDQSPIGRTPRSNPATYTKALDPIRALFARLPEAKVRGYAPGRFSFNVPGGRCEQCEGRGYKRIEMDFLEDVWIECEACDTTRFNHETLQVRFNGRSIADVLALSVGQALELFADVPPVARVLRTLADVGLDYLQLGQPAPTLSGGEAQRIKLARELSRKATGRTLYILDEPTTGLHFEDIRRLLAVLQRLVEGGNTVVVIEHNLDVVKTADWVIDLGPEGGAGGGRLVAAGTPEQVAAVDASYTGQSLQPVLGLTARQPIVPPSRNGQGRTNESGLTPWAPLEAVVVQGARVHNLRNVDAEIPRGKLTVLTGVSGSGKSSLALDTIYAEGQRRYVESLSSYARQFIRQLEKPPVDYVSGLSPAISIEQRPGSRNPRSTVGTVTEVYDYLRVLWARLGQRHCVDCGGRVGRQSADEIVGRLQVLPEGTRVLVLGALQLARGEEYAEAFARLRREGYQRARVDGEVHLLADEIGIDRRRQHEVEVVVDRLALPTEDRQRLAEAVEAAIRLGDGQVTVEVLTANPEQGLRAGDLLFSTRWSCADCGRAYGDLGPAHFSFNTAVGWCETCQGLGYYEDFVPELIIADEREPLNQTAVPLLPYLLRRRDTRVALDGLLAARGIEGDLPLEEWPARVRAELLHGADEPVPFTTVGGLKTTIYFAGLVKLLRELHAGGQYTAELGAARGEVPCLACAGARLRPEAANVRWLGQTLLDACTEPLADLLPRLAAVELSVREATIAAEPLREALRRLRFLHEVGLGYLTLGRASGSLSGGEAMRIRLASQIGGGLTGVLYILDEPTIGLHARDNARLLEALERLRDLGNTVLMVEHDLEAIRRGDFVLDFGPGAGASGGRIVAQGAPQALKSRGESLTADYLSGRREIPVPKQRRLGSGRVLRISGARQNNLRGIDVDFPLGTLIAVTGVSGSGKSSLVVDTLHPALARALHRARQPVGLHAGLDGLEYVDKVISIDQQPLGENPRSNPASYTGIFALIRELYALLPESRARGYTEAHFSFNRPGGRCESCWGYGSRKVEMHFLADIWVPCEACEGKRFNPPTLEIEFKGATIADVLDMTVDQALAHFADIPRLRRALKTLSAVGLGYLQLGQSALTLSGGEAQRVKLARELSRPSTGNTVYILDEPTTGLHLDDVRKLLLMLQRLVDAGNTVIVIEHNLDVIKCADHIIDLGPEGGGGGGYLLATGTPEAVVASASGPTALALAPLLGGGVGPQLVAGEAGAEPISDPEERWHRQQMAFSHERDGVWSPADLESLLASLREVHERVSRIDWSNREWVSVYVEGERRWWARIRTSRPDSLRLLVRSGQRQPNWIKPDLLQGKPTWNTVDPTTTRRGLRADIRREDGEMVSVLDLVGAADWSEPAWVDVLGKLLQAFCEARQ